LKQYVEDIEAEAGRFLDQLGRIKVSCAGIGGGTPSLLSEDQLERLSSVLFGGLLDIDDGAYFSVEMNPDTTTEGKVAVLANAGANRFSLGVQSFTPEVLTRAGRGAQDPATVEDAVKAVRSGADVHLNIDLLAPLAGETESTMEQGVGRAVDLGADSIIMYRYQPVFRKGVRVDPGRVSFSRAGEVLSDVAARAGYDFRIRTRTATIVMKEAPNWDGPRYEHHPDHPSSLLAFGQFGESHVFDRGIYRVGIGTNGGLVYRGTELNAGYECRSFAARAIARMQPVVIRDFERAFGLDPLDMFEDELALLVRMGYVVVGDGEIRPRFSDSEDTGLYAGMFFDDDTIERLAFMYGRNED